MSKSGQRPHVHTDITRTAPATKTTGATRGSGSDNEASAASFGTIFLRFFAKPRFTLGMVTQMIGLSSRGARPLDVTKLSRSNARRCSRCAGLVHDRPSQRAKEYHCLRANRGIAV